MTMRWWWLAYSDASRPPGQRALGAVVIRCSSADEAIDVAKRMRIAPGGDGIDVVSAYMPAEIGNPPAMYIGRLLNAQQAAELARTWDPGHPGLATPDDIRRAFIDDDAAPGDPLFKDGK